MLAAQISQIDMAGSAGVVEMGKLRADTSLVFQPSVFLANALAAFALNLVRDCLLQDRAATTCLSTHLLNQLQ